MQRWIEQLSTCRVLVASLGETDEWWRSTALNRNGISFLSYLYPRTVHLAAVETASLAARIEHDTRIMSRNHFHLFRLPVADEALIRGWLETPSGSTLLSQIVDLSRDERLNALRELAGSERMSSVLGPVNTGTLTALRNGRVTAKIAAAYASAFSRRERVYPYLEHETA